MKPTGIVRRIDDLGRVVMPKELRRTLRIREGDPLEVYLSGDSVILKRYAPKTGEIGDFSQDYAKTLSEVTGHIALIANKEFFVAVAGVPRREFIDKPIPDNWIQQSQKSLSGIFEYEDNKTEESRTIAYTTIVDEGQVIGTVFLLSKKPATSMGDLELKLTDTAANFIVKQIN